MAKHKANTTAGRYTDHILYLLKDEEGWFTHNPATGADWLVADEDGNQLAAECEWKAAAKAAMNKFPTADVRMGC